MRSGAGAPERDETRQNRQKLPFAHPDGDIRGNSPLSTAQAFRIEACQEQLILTLKPHQRYRSQNIAGDIVRHGWFATSEWNASTGRAHCMDVGRATLLILLAASFRAVVAQSSLAVEEPGDETRSGAILLVLVDGQIISGHVTPRPDGYDIQVSAGRIFINSDRVRFTAANLPDAYARMRDSISEFTPANHLELARWCLGNKLYSQARREVLDALHLDPNRDDAKRMLRALDHVGEASHQRLKNTGFTEYPSQTEIQRPVMESRSLAGLNQAVSHAFVRDVQKLLMNKCANSGCHGTNANSEFQMVWSLRGSTPAIAERNLAAVLKQIDFSRPAESPLLKIGEQAHGNMASSAFQGRSGVMQFKVLQDWVLQASHDIAPDAIAEATEQDGSDYRIVRSGIQQASATNEIQGRVTTLRTPDGAPGNPHARQLTTDDTDGKFLREATYANRRDAFSPEEFNRRYHDGVANDTANQKTTNESSDAQVP